MSALREYLAMGGYAAFVWPAYGLTVIMLCGLAWQSWRRYRESIGRIDRLQRRRNSP